MQLAQLFRRGVVVPLTDDAAVQLARCSVDTTARVELLSIPDDALFGEIWAAGIFQAINRACGSLIDDYEEECLPPNVLSDALAALEEIHAQIKHPAAHAFSMELIALFERAKRDGREMYFVL